RLADHVAECATRCEPDRAVPGALVVDRLVTVAVVVLLNGRGKSSTQNIKRTANYDARRQSHRQLCPGPGGRGPRGPPRDGATENRLLLPRLGTHKTRPAADKALV